ncbi:glycoside hydrolase superfamily [Cyathus striatus]|nr:glycoside hydrolase superfamily [Cyathus striatus]
MRQGLLAMSMPTANYCAGTVPDGESVMKVGRRTLKDTPEALAGWHSIGGAQINVIAAPLPVSTALPNCLEVNFPSGKIAPVGFGNEGYFGTLKVNTSLTYKASFYYRFPTASTFKGSAIVGFQTSTGLSLGSATVALNGAQTSWLQVTVSVKPVQAPTNNNNLFSITLDGATSAGQTIHFAMLSLFPPTFNSVLNGMRVDIAQALQELAPGFLRFPGGKNLGNTIQDRWQWNATVGPVVNRPGRMGSWGYVNTDGLGLYEFLIFAEAIKAKPIMGVYSGQSLSGDSVEEEDLGPYIQQAIDQINFAIGPTTTTQGAMRSTLGHAAAFQLAFVEIGSEEFMSSDTYQTRWLDFVTILSQKFPQLKFIAASSANDPTLVPDPTTWDIHLFQTPGKLIHVSRQMYYVSDHARVGWLAQSSTFYDSFQRNGTTYLEGEYASISTDDSDPNDNRLTFPTMQSALGEAAFMTGLERNSDIVFGAAYAPLLNNVAGSQLTPSLISFDINNVYRSTSFYVQKLFSTNRGTQYVPSTVPDPNGVLFWSVSFTSPSHIFKIVNTGNSPEIITFIHPSFTVGTGTFILFNGTSTASNNPTTPNAVIPAAAKTTAMGAVRQWAYVAPPNSLTIFKAINEAYSNKAQSGTTEAYAKNVAQAFGYSAEQLQSIPVESQLGLGCGNPSLLHTSKKRRNRRITIRDEGRSYRTSNWIRHVCGHDRLARKNAKKQNFKPPQVSFVQTQLTDELPIVSDSVDCIISNCVINLLPLSGKANVLKESFRILKPGGRIVVSDIVAKKELPDDIKNDLTAYIDAGFQGSRVLLSFWLLMLTENHVEVLFLLFLPPKRPKPDFDANEWVASYQIYALKPGSTPTSGAPTAALNNWWDAYPKVQSPQHPLLQKNSCSYRNPSASEKDFAVIDVRRNDHAVEWAWAEECRVVPGLSHEVGEGHASKSYVMQGGIVGWLEKFGGEEDLVDRD